MESGQYACRNRPTPVGVTSGVVASTQLPQNLLPWSYQAPGLAFALSSPCLAVSIVRSSCFVVVARGMQCFTDLWRMQHGGLPGRRTAQLKCLPSPTLLRAKGGFL
jgi:hypothetical protein